METGLRNRVVIVAASSQGIGRATAEAFAAEGCRLAICARNREALNAVAEKIRSQHQTEIVAESFDVSDANAVRDFVNAIVQKFGSVDVCVTNGGGPPAKGFLATTIEEWKRAVDVNFMSAVYFAHQVIPLMQKKKWGRIITITSITTKQPVADLVYSNAVRAAVVGLVKSLANEFGKDGILVNNVGPGFTATERLKAGERSVRKLGGGNCPEASGRAARTGRHDCLARQRARFLHHRTDDPGRRWSVQRPVKCFIEMPL